MRKSVTIVGRGLLDDEDLVSRFWDKVVKQPDGCWDWVGGYHRPDVFERVAVVSCPGRLTIPAAAFAWALELGTGKQGTVPKLLPKCRSFVCVRPTHMVVGRWDHAAGSRPRIQRVWRESERTGSVAAAAAGAGVTVDALRDAFEWLEFNEARMDRVRALMAVDRMGARGGHFRA